MSSIIKKEARDLQSIDYVLCEHDVNCGRGNQCFHHICNQKFRKIVLDNLNRYSDTIRKYDKSSIIDEIVDQVRENCRPYNGLGFVRKDTTTGRFYEVGNFIAVSMKVMFVILSCMTHEFQYSCKLEVSSQRVSFCPSSYYRSVKKHHKRFVMHHLKNQILLK